MKRLYIITGAKGHLASTIIKQLKNTDCFIRGLILDTEHGEDDKQITYYKGDVTKPETLKAIFSGIEHNEVIVIHAAGIISIGETVSKQMYSVNVIGTRNIVNECKIHNIKRLVYVSSVHAIPEAENGAIIEEVRSFSPQAVIGGYAQTKAEASQIVIDAAKNGMDAVIVHPSGIIGPYDAGNNHLTQLIQMYLSGKLPAGVTGGYDFVDVRDVAQGCIEAAESGKAGECYILSNRYCTVKELLEFMRQAAGGRKKICFPLSWAKRMAPVFEWIAKITHTRPLFTKYSLHTMDSNGHFSHDKATMQLGYHPRDIKTTIADTIDWLKKNHLTVVQ